MYLPSRSATVSHGFTARLAQPASVTSTQRTSNSQSHWTTPSKLRADYRAARSAAAVLLQGANERSVRAAARAAPRQDSPCATSRAERWPTGGCFRIFRRRRSPRWRDSPSRTPRPRQGPRAPRSARAPLGVDRQRRLARPRPALGRRAARRGRREALRRDRGRRRAGREGLRRRRACAGQHHVGVHGRPDLPDAAGEALDRPHLAARGRRPRGGRGRAHGASATARSRTPTSTGRWSATTRSSPTTASPRGSTGRRPRPRASPEVRGVDEQLRIQDRVAQLLRARRLEHGALTLETVEARAVFDDGALTDLVPERRNRAKDLIEDLMIAANGATARFLEQKGFPSLRRVLRSPERWAKIVGAGGVARREAPAGAVERRARRLLEEARARPIPSASPISRSRS